MKTVKTEDISVTRHITDGAKEPVHGEHAEKSGYMTREDVLIGALQAICGGREAAVELLGRS
jgi:hypothetical protein